METFRFPKGITTTYIPFMLHDFSPWQDQINKEIEKLNNRYKFGKSHHVGFEITNYGATIKITKQ